ncbi:reverse transcriptase N-terminal domain-containing protein [Nocardia sp. NPDC101769]
MSTNKRSEVAAQNLQATWNQDWAQVRSLQKLMLGSWSNTLLSVRQG